MRHLILICLTTAVVVAADLPGTLTTSWVGNSFPGQGGHASGKWVPNFCDEIEVTPDGTVVSHSTWDEAGRCIGLFKDGAVNTSLVRQFNGKGGHKSWGWGTAGRAMAIDGDALFAINLDGHLMRFTWKPDDIDSTQYTSHVEVGGQAVGLNARTGRLVACMEDGTVRFFDQQTLAEQSRFTVPGAIDVALEDGGTLWVLARDGLRRYQVDGTVIGAPLAGAGSPSAISIDPIGRLIVSDNGPRQQVLIFDLAGKQPKLQETLGDAGGLTASKGRVLPGTLFAIKGAGADRAGNITVACNNDRGLTLKTFDASGVLQRELHGLTFLDNYDFDPTSDGTVLYSVDQIIDLDLDSGKAPGAEWRLRSVTLEPGADAKDPRHGARGETASCSAFIRQIDGRRLLWTIGQTSGAMNLYKFDENSDLSRLAGRFDKGTSWAIDVDSNGSVWNGSAPGNTIRCYPCAGWNPDGSARYDWDKPLVFPTPEGFTEVARVMYIPASDSLLISGYTKDQPAQSWGLAGSVMRRYDGWVKGARTLAWNADLPQDDTHLHPKSVAQAGDYIFFGACQPTKGVLSVVHVLRLSDGVRIGAMQPDATAGDRGWIDISHGVRAFKRASGEYLVTVEEVARGKNLLYRWHPAAAK